MKYQNLCSYFVVQITLQWTVSVWKIGIRQLRNIKHERRHKDRAKLPQIEIWNNAEGGTFEFRKPFVNYKWKSKLKSFESCQKAKWNRK